MKKLTAVFLCLCLLLAGCRARPDETTVPPPETTSQPSQTTSAPETTSAEDAPLLTVELPLFAAAINSHTETLTAEDGTLLFRYTYPSLSLTLPDGEIADRVILDFLNRTDESRLEAKSLSADAKTSTDGPYFYDLGYTPVRLDSGILSLWGNVASFAGGIHANSYAASLTYDLTTGEYLSLGDILTEKTTADSIVTLICAALEVYAQEGRLFPDYAASIEDRFSGDFSQDSGWYLSNQGLCFYFSPYEIASYAEGTILAEIPYEVLSGVLVDGYFPPERVAVNGLVSAKLFQEEMFDTYDHFAEFSLNENGIRFLVDAQGAVYDLMIESGTQADGSGFTPDGSCFAAYGLSGENAVIVQSLLSDAISTFRISYTSGSETVTQFVTQGSGDGAIYLIP